MIIETIRKNDSKNRVTIKGGTYFDLFTKITFSMVYA